MAVSAADLAEWQAARAGGSGFRGGGGSVPAEDLAEWRAAQIARLPRATDEDEAAVAALPAEAQARVGPLVEQYRAAGLSPEQARLRALERFEVGPTPAATAEGAPSFRREYGRTAQEVAKYRPPAGPLWGPTGFVETGTRGVEEIARRVREGAETPGQRLAGNVLGALPALSPTRVVSTTAGLAAGLAEDPAGAGAEMVPFAPWVAGAFRGAHEEGDVEGVLSGFARAVEEEPLQPVFGALGLKAGIGTAAALRRAVAARRAAPPPRLKALPPPRVIPVTPEGQAVMPRVRRMVPPGGLLEATPEQIAQHPAVRGSPVPELRGPELVPPPETPLPGAPPVPRETPPAAAPAPAPPLAAVRAGRKGRAAVRPVPAGAQARARVPAVPPSPVGAAPAPAVVSRERPISLPVAPSEGPMPPRGQTAEPPVSLSPAAPLSGSPPTRAAERGAVVSPAGVAQAARERWGEVIEAGRAVKTFRYALNKYRFLRDEGFPELEQVNRAADPVRGNAEADSITGVLRDVIAAGKTPTAGEVTAFQAMQAIRDQYRVNPQVARQWLASAMRNPDFRRLEAVRRWLYGFEGRSGWIDSEVQAAFPGLPRDPYYVPRVVRAGSELAKIIATGDHAKIAEAMASSTEPRAARPAKVRRHGFTQKMEGGGEWHPDFFAQMRADLGRKIVGGRAHILIREALKTGRPLARGEVPREGFRRHVLNGYEVELAKEYGILPNDVPTSAVQHWEVKPSVEIALKQYREAVSATAPAWSVVNGVNRALASAGVSWDLRGFGVTMRSLQLASSLSRPWEARFLIMHAFLRGAVNAGGAAPKIAGAIIGDARLRNWARIKPDEAAAVLRYMRETQIETARVPKEELLGWLDIANRTQYAPSGAQQIARIALVDMLQRPTVLRRALTATAGRVGKPIGVAVEKATGASPIDLRDPKQLRQLERDVNFVVWRTALKDASPTAKAQVGLLVRFPSARAAAVRAASAAVRDPRRLFRLAIGYSVANRMISGHWPWENETANLGRIELRAKRDDGTTYSLPALGGIGMLLRASGALDLARRALDRQGLTMQDIEAWASSVPANFAREATHAASPAFGGAYVVATGKDPITGRDVAPPGSGIRMAETGKALVRSVAPPFGAAFAPHDPGEATAERAMKVGGALLGVPTPEARESPGVSPGRYDAGRLRAFFEDRVRRGEDTAAEGIERLRKAGVLQPGDARRMVRMQVEAQLPRQTRDVLRTVRSRNPRAAQYLYDR